MMSNCSRTSFISRTAAAAGAFVTLGAGPDTKTNASLKIAIAASDGVTAVVYAATSGLFERAGIDVQIEKLANGGAVAAAVASETYDIGNSSVSTICIAHQRGVPVTLVAPAGLNSSKIETSGVLVLKDTPFMMGKDAENALVGVISLSDVAHDAACAWVEQHGGDPTLIKFVEIPFSASASSVEQGRVAAAETATPALMVAMDSGKFRLIPIFDAIAPLLLISAWFTTKNFSSKHPDVVRTFARVVAAAATYANAHHAETAPIMSQFTGIEVAEMLRMPRILLGTTLNPVLIQPAINAAAKYGSLKEAFPAKDVIDSNVLGLSS